MNIIDRPCDWLCFAPFNVGCVRAPCRHNLRQDVWEPRHWPKHGQLVKRYPTDWSSDRSKHECLPVLNAELPPPGWPHTTQHALHWTENWTTGPRCEDRLARAGLLWPSKYPNATSLSVKKKECKGDNSTRLLYKTFRVNFPLFYNSPLHRILISKTPNLHRFSFY